MDDHDVLVVVSDKDMNTRRGGRSAQHEQEEETQRFYSGQYSGAEHARARSETMDQYPRQPGHAGARNGKSPEFEGVLLQAFESGANTP
ncbi:hypothetical protein GSI_08738 [Ganoderma sinense ZZ0214-1]|uniref:Uncharacterized protein n=1 Tax=Ganoderma sinense ZZ0214-1 TaxID=1077348 RepID=A0A2G8S4N5_9APHY|nr:hypothetical protein GSI_08738 [Ganoderma sinense ZZ0214-1]